MKATGGHQGGWVIVVSFVAALVLTILPLPDWLQVLWPEWGALVLLYWCLALPERISVGTAWVVGLLLDVLHGSLLGQHALAMTVIAYLTVNLHQRIRLYPLWQQALTVLMLLALYQLLLMWFDGIIGQPTKPWTYWLPPLTGMLLWPGSFLLLREIRRRFQVS